LTFARALGCCIASPQGSSMAPKGMLKSQKSQSTLQTNFSNCTVYEFMSPCCVGRLCGTTLQITHAPDACLYPPKSRSVMDSVVDKCSCMLCVIAIDHRATVTPPSKKSACSLPAIVRFHEDLVSKHHHVTGRSPVNNEWRGDTIAVVQCKR